MVGREIELKGVPGKSLLFTLKGKHQLFEFMQVRTENQFGQKIEQMQREDLIDDEFFYTLYLIGLNWKKDTPPVLLEEVPEIIEEFCQVNGYANQEVRDTIIDALCNSGILNPSIVKANRKLRDSFDDAKVESLIKKRIEQIENRGIDTGETGQTSTLTK